MLGTVYDEIVYAVAGHVQLIQHVYLHSDPLRQRLRLGVLRGTLVVVASWWGWAVCALRQPGVG